MNGSKSQTDISSDFSAFRDSKGEEYHTDRSSYAEYRADQNKIFELIKHHSAMMLLINSESGKILDANEAAQHFYGWHLGRLKQMHIQEINTQPPEVVRAQMQRVIALKNVKFEHRHRRADGSIRDVEVYCDRLDGPNEGLLLSIIFDITDRKRSEEVRQEETLFLRSILQTTADGFWVVDEKGKIIQVNEAYCRMSGYTSEELVKLDVSSLDAFDSADAVSARVKRLMVYGSEFFEAYHRRKDGSLFPVEMSVTYVPSSPARFVCFCRDISERKQWQLALQKKREDMQTILDSSPTVIFLKDCSNNFVHVNKAFEKLTGLKREELQGQSVSSVLPDLAKKSWEDDSGIIETGKAKTDILYEIETPMGPRWFKTDKIPYKDVDGNIVGVVGFSVDITESKLAAEKLENINRELEKRVEERTRELKEKHLQYLHAEKLSALGKLSASIAHEFNNPLQSVMTVLNGLKKRAIIDNEDRDLLDAAIEESNRMKNLIRSLQEFKRPSADKQAVTYVRESIKSLLLLHKNDFRNKRITVEQNYAEKLPKILAVPDQIKQVLLNLLANAADACQPQGGTITISTWAEKNKIAISIKDTGKGMEPDEMASLYQPFFTTKVGGKGNGLGLAVSNSIIASHKGEIQVVSEPGKGATFTVYLPSQSGLSG